MDRKVQGSHTCSIEERKIVEKTQVTRSARKAPTRNMAKKSFLDVLIEKMIQLEYHQTPDNFGVF
jgi:hypothetical protein